MQRARANWALEEIRDGLETSSSSTCIVNTRVCVTRAKWNKTAKFFSSQIPRHKSRNNTEFVNWYLHELHTREIDPTLISFSDEICFHFSGYVNPFNNRFTMLIHALPLLDVKVGVWCAVGANSGPTFFWALNAHLYVKQSEVIVTNSLITREPLPFCFSKTVQRLTPQSLLFFVYKIFWL